MKNSGITKVMEVPIQKAIKTILNQYQYKEMIDFSKSRYNKLFVQAKISFPFMVHSTDNKHAVSLD